MERLPPRPLVEPYRKIAEKAGGYFSQRVVINSYGTLTTAGFFRRIAMFFSELRKKPHASVPNNQIKNDFLTTIRKSFTDKAANEAEQTINGIKQKSLRAKHVRKILRQAELTDGASTRPKSAVNQLQSPATAELQDSTFSAPASSAPEIKSHQPIGDTENTSSDKHDPADETGGRQSPAPAQTEQPQQFVSSDKIDFGQDQGKDAILSHAQKTDQFQVGKINPNLPSINTFSTLSTHRHYPINPRFITDALTNRKANQKQVDPEKNPAKNEDTNRKEIDPHSAITDEYNNLD